MRLRLEFRSYIRSLGHLLVPRVCVVCGRVLLEGEYLACTECRWNMPLTNTWNDPDNLIREKLNNLFMAEQGCAFFFYHKKSGYDELIHRFKYNGKTSLAYELGRWFGEELKRSGFYDDIDIILPVPLHPLRKLKRGYNQSEYIARGIGRSLGKRVRTGNLIRTVHNRSQTHHMAVDRWDNVSGIFGVRNPKELQGKHVLLVDDVLTTGATLESCAEVLRDRVEGVRISAVTLSVSPRDFI